MQWRREVEMTNKEAINILRNAAWLGTDVERDLIEEAVQMAVNALTKEAWKEEHPVSPLLQKLSTNLQHSKQDDLIASAQPECEHTMEEFMYGQDRGNPEDGSL